MLEESGFERPSGAKSDLNATNGTAKIQHGLYIHHQKTTSHGVAIIHRTAVPLVDTKGSSSVCFFMSFDPLGGVLPAGTMVSFTCPSAHCAAGASWVPASYGPSIGTETQ